MTTLKGMPDIETTEFLLSMIDDFTTPQAYNHYTVGWAHAMCTPYQWTKQIASHWGGARSRTIVHWTNGIADKGAIRNQFHHVGGALHRPTLERSSISSCGLTLLAILPRGSVAGPPGMEYGEARSTNAARRLTRTGARERWVACLPSVRSAWRRWVR
jgi:hypothetical protein